VLLSADFVPLPQPRLKYGERADLSTPGLKNDKRDRGQMSKAKPRRVHPTPPRKAVADNHEEQTSHNKDDDAEMCNEDNIGKEVIWHLYGCYVA